MLKRKIQFNDDTFELAVSQHGKGAPTSKTEGLIGVQYRDDNNGRVYRCIDETEGNYKWEIIPMIDDENPAPDKVFSSVKMGEEFENVDSKIESESNMYSPALRKSVSGSVISVSDSAEDCGVECKLSNKNIWSLGNQKDVTFIRLELNPPLEPGVYTISMLGEKVGEFDARYSWHIGKYGNIDANWLDYGVRTKKTVTVEKPEKYFLLYSSSGNAAGSKDKHANFTDIQIEKGSDATPYTPHISDFSDVKVTRTGKNLNPNPDINYGNVPSFEKAFPIPANTPFTVSMNVSGATKWRFNYVLYHENGEIVKDDAGTKAKHLTALDDRPLQYFVAQGNYTWLLNYAYTKQALITDDNYYMAVSLYAGDSSEMHGSNCQVEIGTVQTDYEPYNSIQKVNALSDGAVKGIKSASPTMNIFTDNPGVIIDAEYTCDTVNTVNTPIANNSYADSIPVTETGAVIATDMVSRNEHDVECKVEKINLIPYPYTESTTTRDGITYKVNNDGSVSLSGTASADSHFKIAQFVNVDIPAGNYILTGIPGEQAESSVLLDFVFKNAENISFVSKAQYGEPVKFNLPEDCKIFYCRIRVRPGTDTTGITVKPMLSKFSVPYTPYVPELTAVTVKQYGSNLFNSSQLLKADGWTENDGIYSGTVNAVSLLYGNGFDLPTFGSNTSYNISFKGSTEGGTPYIIVVYTDGSKSNSMRLADNVLREYSLQTDPNKTVKSINITYGTGKENLMRLADFNISICNNTYEPYIDLPHFPVDSDGTVHGMKSISPSMTILTDNPGVLIEAAYNADTKKYIHDNAMTPEQQTQQQKNTSDIARHEAAIETKADKTVVSQNEADSKARDENLNNSFALALRGTTSGEVITLSESDAVADGVGMRCRVESKNLLPDQPVYSSSSPNVFPAIVLLEETFFSEITISAKLTEFTSKTDVGTFLTAEDSAGHTILDVSGNSMGFVAMSKQPQTGIVKFTAKNVRLKKIIFYNWFGGIGISNFQIEKGHIATAYTPYIPDLTAVTVSQYGGNLCDGIMESGKFSNQGEPIPAGSNVRAKNFVRVEPSTTYSLTSDIRPSDLLWVIGYDTNKVGVTDGDGGTAFLNSAGLFSARTEFKTSKTTAYVKFYVTGPNASNTMLNKGKAIPYTPYFNNAFTPNAEGTVSGMTSIAPDMTILSDTPGVIINAEYTKDTVNKVPVPVNGQCFSPAIQATMTGTAVATDMVSPVKHAVECKVQTNEFDISKVIPSAEVTVDGNGLSITGDAVSGNEPFSLAQYAPNLKAGDTIVMNAESNDDRIYLSGAKVFLKFGVPTILTEAMLKSRVMWKSVGPYPAKIQNIRIFKGSVDFGFVPHIPDLTAVTVSQLGGNLFDPNKQPDDGQYSECTPTATGFILSNTSDDPSGWRSAVWNFPALPDGKVYKVATDIISSSPLLTPFVGGYNDRIFIAMHNSVDYPAGAMDATVTFQKVMVSIENEPYSPFIPQKTFKPNAEGIVSGMESISPDMTILTDNPGAVITATYNADTEGFINHVNKPLISRIEALEEAILPKEGGKA